MREELNNKCICDLHMCVLSWLDYQERIKSFEEVSSVSMCSGWPTWRRLLWPSLDEATALVTSLVRMEISWRSVRPCVTYSGNDSSGLEES